MRAPREDFAIAICAGALAAALASCSHRPLPFDGDGAGGVGPGSGGASGVAGAGGGAAPRGLKLIGEPRLLLDVPVTAAQLYTALLWTGDEYLFVWRSYDSAGVFMQRLDTSGQTIDGGGNMRLLNYESAVDLAWGGDRLAAVWKRRNAVAGTDLFFQAFDREARPLRDEVKLRSSTSIDIDGGITYGPRIAAIAGGFALAWYEGQVVAATVTVDGRAQQGPEPAGGDDLASAPTLGLAAEGDRIQVSWNGWPSSSRPSALPTAVMSTRAFTRQLQALGAAQVLDGDGFLAGTHQVLATGSGFLALWGSDPANAAPIAVAQLDTDGVARAAATMAPPIAGPYRSLAPAAWNGDHLVVLWDRSPTNENGLTLTRFGVDGVAQGPSIALPTLGPASRLCVTAHGGQDRIVGFIWSEEIPGAYEVYFQQAMAVP